MTKQPICVKRSDDSQHHVYTFQPNQVYRLIDLIENYDMRVMANIAGTMSSIDCLCSDVGRDFFIHDLRMLCQYKSPIVVAKIQPRYKRVLIIRVDQKGCDN